jgi:hypothetical protein
MCAAESATRGRFHIFERFYGLAEIVERGVVGLCPAEAFIYPSSSAIAAGLVRFCVALDSRTRHLRASCLVRRTP